MYSPLGGDHLSDSSARLAAEVERLTLIVEGLGDGVWDLDPRTGDMQCSGRFREQLGIPSEAETPCTYEALVACLHPDDRERFESELHEHLEQRAPFDLEVRVRSHDGDHRWFRSRGRARWDADGCAVRMVGLHSDITERRFDLQRLRESEANFRSLCGASPVGIFRTDASGLCVYCNDRWQEIFGLDDLDAMGVGWADAILPEDRDRVFVAWAAYAVDSAAHFDLEFRIGDESRPRWVRARANPVRNERGVVMGHVGTTEDVSERQAAAEALQRREEDFRQLSASSPVGIFKLDLRGRCMYCNERWVAFTGLSVEHSLGWGWRNAIHPEDAESALRTWTEATAAEQDVALEARVLTQSGEVRWAAVRACPVRDSRGQVAGYVGTVEDMTARHQVEFTLAEARDRAIEAVRAKSEFLANMSHEIRTPLNGVIGMTELLYGTPLDDEQRDFVRTINTSADALLNIINDILDFSKIEAGKLNIESVDVDVREQLEDVAELVAVRAREHGLELVIDVDPELPRHLMGDPVRIRQILLNLASNATKFTHQGEVVIGATQLCSGEGQSRVKLWVKDSGIGIPPERQGAVFESFTQVDGSTTRKYGGTGLGLTICRQLATLMGGTIHLASEVGVGSEFWVELPMAHAISLSPSTRRFEATYDLAGTRVLVVDDHSLNRRILMEMLRSWGCRPEGAASGEEALARIALEKHDPHRVVIQDYLMDGIDGAETAARMQDLPGASERVVIMLSSGGSIANAEERERIGVNAWLTKPAREVSLHRALCGALGRAQAMHSTLSAESEAPVAADYSGFRLLIAEDNEVNRKVALRMLKKLGASADIAVNGREAVRMTGERHYDAVFMDCQMPEQDGFEATTEIRAREAQGAQRVRIVAMTANAMEGDRERCIACGMDDYVSKPVKLERLVEQLDVLAKRVRSAPDRRAAA